MDPLDHRALRAARLGAVLPAPRDPRLASRLSDLIGGPSAGHRVFELATPQVLREAQARLQHLGLRRLSQAGSGRLTGNLTITGPGLITSAGLALSNAQPLSAPMPAGFQLSGVPAWPQTESVLILDELDMTNKTLTVVAGAVSHLFVIVRRLTAATGALITYVPTAQPLVGAPGLDGSPDPGSPSHDRTARIGEKANNPSADGGTGPAGAAGGTGPGGVDAPDLTIVALEIDAMPDIRLPGQKGGAGGPGGRGARGGDGQRGRDCHSTWFDCRHGPGHGGTGGAGGAGGAGGQGGPGGTGATVTVTTQESQLLGVVTARRFVLDLGGGAGGDPGVQGDPGQGGRGGMDGYAYGRCDRRPERAGADGPPGRHTGTLGVGSPGQPGDLGYTVITQEQWNQLVERPWLTSADPISGPPGTAVVLHGANLTPALHGELAMPGSAPVLAATTHLHAQQVTVRIPDTAEGGRAVLRLTDGTVASNEVPFAVRPALRAATRDGVPVASAYAGETVELAGAAIRPGATVTDGGRPLPTTVVSRVRVAVTLPAVTGLDAGGTMRLVVTNPDGLASDPFELVRLPQVDSGFRADHDGFAFRNFSEGQNVGLDTYAATFGADEVALQTLLDPRVSGLFFAFYHWFLTHNGHCTALSSLALENFHQRRPALFGQGPSSADDPPPVTDELMERINVVQGRVISRDLMAYYAAQSAQGVDRVEATVREIEAGLTGPQRLVDARVLCFVPSGTVWEMVTDPQLRAALADGHCVVPTRIVYPGASRDLDGARLYVYDNNRPGDDGRHLRLFRRDGTLHFEYTYTYAGGGSMTYSPATGFTLGTARLQEQLLDDVDVPFAEIEAGLSVAGFVADLVLSPALACVSDTSGRLLGYRDGVVHADPAVGWVRPGLENYLMIRAEAEIKERLITGTGSGTYSYATLRPGGRTVAMTDIPCSPKTRDRLHVDPDGTAVSFTGSEDKTVLLHVGALVRGAVRSLSVTTRLAARQKLTLELDPDLDEVRVSGPAGGTVGITARLAEGGDVLDTRTVSGTLPTGGAASLPSKAWADLSRLSGFGTAPVTHRTHVVQRGDTLWSIARTYYGTAERWKEIAELNLIARPEQLRVGRSIRLP